MLDIATTVRLLVHIFGTSRHPALSSVMTFETDLMAAERLRAMMHESVDAVYDNNVIPTVPTLDDVPLNFIPEVYDNNVIPTVPALDDVPLNFIPEVYDNNVIPTVPALDDIPLNFIPEVYDNYVVPTGPVLIDDAPLDFGPEVFEISYTETLDAPIIEHRLSMNDKTGMPLVERVLQPHVLYILVALIITLHIAFQLKQLVSGKNKKLHTFSFEKCTIRLPSALRRIIITLNLYTWLVTQFIYLAYITIFTTTFTIGSSILGSTGLGSYIESSGDKTVLNMLNGTYEPSATGDIKLVFWQCVTLVFPDLAVLDEHTLSCIVSEMDSVLAPFFPAFIVVALDFVYKMMSIDAQDTTTMLKGKEESQGYISTENEECTTDATWTDDSIWLNYYDSSATESTMSIYTECPTDATWTDDCIWYDYYDSSMTKSTTPIYEEHATDVTWADDSFWLDYYDSSATGFSASNNATSFDSGEDAKPWKKTKRGCRAGRKIQARKARQATEPEPEPVPTSAVSATCPSALEEADVPETV